MEEAMKASFQLSQLIEFYEQRVHSFSFFLSFSVVAAGLAGGTSPMDKLLSCKDAEKQEAILNL